jgi:succinoglycan biosynthesis protein ExoO
MLGHNPTVSVIMPVFNCEKYVHNAIESVINQSFTDFEFIIVDDASSDKSAEIILSFQDSRINFVPLKKNIGPGPARNIGIDLAKGAWGAFIDADDAWDQKRLEKLIHLGKMNPGSFVADDLLMCLSGKSNNFLPWTTFFKKIGLQRYFRESDVLLISPLNFIRYAVGLIHPLVPLEVIKKSNIRFSDLRRNQDMEFFMQLFKHKLQLFILNEPLYIYRASYKTASDSEKYLQVLIAYEYLLQDDGYDKDINKALLFKYIEVARYSLFLVHLKERKWKKVMRMTCSSPGVAREFLRNIPQFFRRRWVALRNNL